MDGTTRETPDDRAGSQLSVSFFRLGDEWLALPMGVLVEVTRPRTPHRVPHRGGLLAGMVNIRGELHLCVRLDLLGVGPPPHDRSLIEASAHRDPPESSWAFAADEVDQVHRVPDET
ncbi:MAG: chemotaxis protein CheW [Gemmataceae bacterium]